MDLNEALNHIQSALNFHAGLQHLKGILEAAVGAEQLQKERAAAAEIAAQALTKAQTELGNFQTSAAAVKTEIQQGIDYMKKQSADLTVELEATRVKAESVCKNAIKAARAKQATVEHELQLVIEAGEKRKQELEDQIAALEQHFQALRDKAASF